MAVKAYAYCNASLGRTCTVYLETSNGSIVDYEVNMLGTCSTPQPRLIQVTSTIINGGELLIGYLVPINVAPYARYVPAGSECLLAVDSIDRANSTTNESSDGTITINASGQVFGTVYSIDGGATYQLDNHFTGLPPGYYSIVVSTGFGSCNAYSNTTLSYNTLVCNLGLGTITTVQSSGADDGKIKVINVTGYPATVEYRLDAGFWQADAEFTGVAAGDHTVSVRFVAYPDCTDSRVVTVGDAVTCDLEITLVDVVNEQSRYGNNGYLSVVTTGGNSGKQYNINGGALQNENAFFNLSPGVYDVSVIDSEGCSDTRTVTVYAYRVPIFAVSNAQAHRFVIQSGPVVTKTRQNFDNTLFADMRVAGVLPGCYSQKFERNDISTVQFKTNYTTSLVNIYDNDDVFKGSLTPIKRTNYVGKTDTVNCFFANAGAGKTQLFVDTGLPLFLEKGLEIVVAGAGPINGTYVIEDLIAGINEATGFEVAIFDLNYPSSGVVAGNITATYNVEPYEVYESIISWAAYPSGKYYITIVCTDPQFAESRAKSEPVHTRASWPKTLLCSYKNTENNFGINYDTGVVFSLRVEGSIKWPLFGGERTVTADSRNNLVKIRGYVRRMPMLYVFALPEYLLEKLALMMEHDYWTVEEIQYQIDEDFEPTYFEGDPLGNGKAKLLTSEYDAENGDDNGGQQNDIDILGTNDTLLGVPS